MWSDIEPCAVPVAPPLPFLTPPLPKFGIGAPNAAASTDSNGRRRRESASAVNLPFAVFLISKQKSLAHRQPHHLTD